MISLTPLIDVVFILLVFFMLASSFLDWRTISLANGPAAPMSPMDGEGMIGAVVVDLGADGTLRLSGQALERATLLDRLDTLLADNPALNVVVRPADDVPVQVVIDLLDVLSRQVGGAVSLQRGA